MPPSIGRDGGVQEAQRMGTMVRVSSEVTSPDLGNDATWLLRAADGRERRRAARLALLAVPGGAAGQGQTMYAVAV